MYFKIMVIFAVVSLTASCFVASQPQARELAVRAPRQSSSPQKNLRGEVFVVGHRGSPLRAPENSMASFREAVRVGAQAIELDVHLSQDNEVVVAHDISLQRTCQPADRKQTNFHIRTLAWRQIQKFRCGSGKDAAPPPSLKEVLAWQQQEAPNTHIFIELKEGNPGKELIAAVTSLLNHESRKHVTLISFESPYLEELQKSGVQVPYGFLVEEGDDFCQAAAALKASVALPHVSLLTAKSMQACKTMGMQVTSWTLNSQAEWDKAIGLGVDGIITNLPGELMERFGGKK